MFLQMHFEHENVPCQDQNLDASKYWKVLLTSDKGELSMPLNGRPSGTKRLQKVSKMLVLSGPQGRGSMR